MSKMGEEHKEDFIADFVDKIKAYEAPYKAGAWEEFARKNKSLPTRRVGNWKYWSAAAAAVFVAVASYLLVMPPSIDPGKSPVLSRTKSLPSTAVKPLALERMDPSSLDSLSSSLTYNNLLAAPISPVKATISPSLAIFQQEDLLAQLEDKPLGKLPMYEDEVMAISLENSLPTYPPEESQKHARTNNFREYAARLQGEELNLTAATATRNKWEVGAFVAPGQTNSQVTMGGGLSVSFKLTDRVALRSGVSLQNYGGKVAGQMAMEMQPASVTQEMVVHDAYPIALKASSRKLNEVSSALVTVDIPLDIQYKISRGLYASLGVSYANIISQNRTNTYLNSVGTETFVGSAANNRIEPKELLQARTSERTNDNLEDTQGFSGFANFSIGQKIPLGKKVSIAVEPYVKLPIGSLKNSTINYSNGGIRLSTSF